ncbi:MAG TPA: class I SAM-dependent methyltransferase [Solirubrobacterales bacterium]|nr:class I SAM-dependent methyltransferase [Solirubrobacterales bacterium]
MAGPQQVPNVCAGPFGSFYDFYIERPWLVRLIGRLVWGVDASVLYTSMDSIARVPTGATIADVPCGGGVALRALDPAQDVRYLAADLSPEMLQRAGRRARERSLPQVELVVADMRELPFADGEIDLFLSYSGLHMVPDPGEAVAEIARCLRPGGRLVGTSFFSDCSRRARAIFAAGGRRGHPLPPSRADLLGWLATAGFDDPSVGPEAGFAVFSGSKPAG